MTEEKQKSAKHTTDFSLVLEHHAPGLSHFRKGLSFCYSLSKRPEKKEKVLYFGEKTGDEKITAI